MSHCAFQVLLPSSLRGDRFTSRRTCPALCPTRMVTKIDAGVTAPKGFKAGGYTAGFKPSGLPDLAIVLAEDNKAVTAAALFTKNLLRAAPVDISEQNLKQSNGMVAAVVLNSGQANAGTGADGFADGIKTTEFAAEAIGCQPSDVFICSTGVIGKRFDINLMRGALPKVVSQASSTVESGTAAATAIMTTDLKLKQIAFQDEVAGSTVTAGGMCKGSGMIHPDMATMLGVVTCDADVEKGLLHKMLKRAVDRSFNAITVDGDTSTNDVVCAMCSGASKVVVQAENSPEAKAVESLLTATCIHLAKSIARDGEGATVLVEVQVSGANTEADARAIAKSIASSSLVKAAIFGRDPNWGRIAAAAGMAGAKFDINDLEIWLGDYLLMSKGNPVPFDAKDASLYMKGKSEAAPEDYLTEHDTVAITVKVGNGEGSGVAWGCDLSYKYVEINAEYTT